MHEYSIVAALIERVEVLAREQHATRVHRLRVQIGELAGVEVELLTTAFATFCDRTICAGAELEVVATPAVWTCPRCRVALPRGARLSCATCAVPARLTQGHEILLERVELEVNDV
jgi:hydrogenase nickel incorporation protein HypA/HybF